MTRLSALNSNGFCCSALETVPLLPLSFLSSTFATVLPEFRFCYGPSRVPLLLQSFPSSAFATVLPKFHFYHTPSPSSTFATVFLLGSLVTRSRCSLGILSSLLQCAHGPLAGISLCAKYINFINKCFLNEQPLAWNSAQPVPNRPSRLRGR